MSRAFLSENESQFDEEDVPEIRNPLPPGARNRMTPEGAARLRQELETLANHERPRAASLIARWTAEAGADRDTLSQARRRLRQIDRRIEYLTRMAQLLEVVDPAAQDPARVLFGAAVTVEEEGAADGAGESVARFAEGAADGAWTTRPADHGRPSAGASSGAAGGAGRSTYRIVGVDEADPAQGRVSWISPIARALTGARVGDTVTLRLPDRQVRLKVLSIEYRREPGGPGGPAAG